MLIKGLRIASDLPFQKHLNKYNVLQTRNDKGVRKTMKTDGYKNRIIDDV